MFPRSATGSSALVGLGALSLGIASVEYSVEEASYAFSGTLAVSAAEAYFVILGLGLLLTTVGVVGLFKATSRSLRSGTTVPTTPGSLLPFLLSEKRYLKHFIVSSLSYALLYSYLTGTLVVGDILPPLANISTPSAAIAACCGPPMFLPTLTVYLSTWLGLFVVPLVLVLLITISALVGVNVVLAEFAFASGVRGVSRGWGLGLGAVVGLFTGCPACASLLFGGLLSGTGGVAFAAVLAGYQPAFIAISIPVLVGTLYLSSRAISKVFTGGCPVGSMKKA